MRVAHGSSGEVFAPTSCGVDTLKGVVTAKAAAMPPTQTWQGGRPSPPTPLSMIVHISGIPVRRLRGWSARWRHLCHHAAIVAAARTPKWCQAPRTSSRCTLICWWQ